ncbi:MAG: M28 family peptidase [Gemmatimonadota bacterium]|nr:M28 family peptidase [Gemmatimonadota bacterium]
MPRRVSARLALALATLTAAPLAAQGGSAARARQKPVWPDEGPMVWAPRPTVPAITANDLRTRLYQFADDSMQGRRIGEPGNYKGTAYIAREFRRMGLRPAGDGGTYFQDMPFGPAGFDRAASRLAAGGTPLAPGSDWIPLGPSTPAGTGGRADLAGVPVVFAGRWADAASVDPALVRGKVAVFLGGPPAGRGFAPRTPAVEPRCDSVPDRFGAEAAVAYEAKQRALAAREGVPEPRPAARAPEGAAAVLFVNLDQLPAAAIAAAFEPRGVMEPAPDAGRPAGAVISRAAAERLFGKPVDQLSVGDAGAAVSGHWRYEWRMSPTPARNVIAIMRGADPAKAGEYVLISAHNDHVGFDHAPVDHDSLRAVNMVTRRQGANDPVCRPTPAQWREIHALIARARRIRPPRPDSIFNGADDDGSGTVIMLEVAEKFAHEHPARSVIFVSHDGEEAGLLGSKWFTDHPTIPLDSIAAALNMDMEAKGHVYQVKFGGPTSIQILGSRRLSQEFGDIIDSVNAVRPVVMAIDHTWDVPANPLNRFCRSDQVNYVHHDVPVAYFSTGYAEDYHQVTDEPQYADYDHMAKIGGFIHDIAMAIATRKNRPAISGPDPSYPQCR